MSRVTLGHIWEDINKPLEFMIKVKTILSELVDETAISDEY
jgi:hypothetical protein